VTAYLAGDRAVKYKLSKDTTHNQIILDCRFIKLGEGRGAMVFNAIFNNISEI
jgi:hypothetical protein